MKKRKECQVFEAFFKYFPGFAGVKIKDWKHHTEHPIAVQKKLQHPDIICTTENDEILGVELTGWIDQQYRSLSASWEKELRKAVGQFPWYMSARIQKPLPDLKYKKGEEKRKGKEELKKIISAISTLCTEIKAHYSSDKSIVLEKCELEQLAAPLGRYIDLMGIFSIPEDETPVIRAVPGLALYSTERQAMFQREWTNIIAGLKGDKLFLSVSAEEQTMQELTNSRSVIQHELQMARSEILNRTNTSDALIVLKREELDRLCLKSLAKFCYSVAGSRTVELPPILLPLSSPATAARWALQENVFKKLTLDYATCTKAYPLKSLHLLVYQDRFDLDLPVFSESDFAQAAKTSIANFPGTVYFEQCLLFSSNVFVKDDVDLNTYLERVLSPDFDPAYKPKICASIWNRGCN